MKKGFFTLTAAICLLALCLFVSGCGTPQPTENETKEATGAETAAETDGVTETATAGETEAVVYAVSFDADGGSEVEGQRVQPGGYAIAPEDPVKAGFIFDGWQTPDGADWDFAKGKVTGDLTLKAKWRESTYTIMLSSVVDPWEEVFKPAEESILAVMNYDYITTQFSSFVNTTDPEADEVYRRLDALTTNRDVEAFINDLKAILGVPKVLDKYKNDNVCSRFRYDYRVKWNEIRDRLQSDDPAVVEAAQTEKAMLLQALQFLIPGVTDLPSESSVGKAFNDVYKDFGNLAADLDGEFVLLPIGAECASADELAAANRLSLTFECDDNLMPCKPKDESEVGEGNLFPDGTPVTDVNSAADPANWYTMTGQNALAPIGHPDSLSDFSGYVIKRTFTLAAPAGQRVEDAVFLVTCTNANGDNVAPVRVMMTFEDNLWRVYSEYRRASRYKSSKLMLIPEGEVLTVTLYVYIDGTDPECTIDFADSLGHVLIDVRFTAVVPVPEE